MNTSSDDKILTMLCERVFAEALPDCTLLDTTDQDSEEVELVAVVGFSGDDTRGVLGVSAPPEAGWLSAPPVPSRPRTTTLLSRRGWRSSGRH